MVVVLIATAQDEEAEVGTAIGGTRVGIEILQIQTMLSVLPAEIIIVVTVALVHDQDPLSMIDTTDRLVESDAMMTTVLGIAARGVIAMVGASGRQAQSL